MTVSIGQIVGDPAAIGLGRLPIAPALDPYDDVEPALASDTSPWVRSLDGPWRFRLHHSPADRGPGDVSGDARAGWDEVAVPGSRGQPADGERG